MRHIKLMGLIMILSLSQKANSQTALASYYNYLIDTSYHIYCFTLNNAISPTFDKPAFDSYLASKGVSITNRNNLLNQIAFVKHAYPRFINATLKTKIFAFSQNGNIQSLINACGSSINGSYKKVRPRKSYTPNDYSPTFFVGPNTTGKPISSSHLESVQAREAWDISKGDARVKVGIIDEGIITPLHPELLGRVVILSNPTPDGHGTEVTGYAVGKTDNNSGMASISGFNTIAYFHSWHDPYNSMKEMAVDYKVRVVNNSWVQFSCSPFIDEQLALDELRNVDNLLVVFAAGNGDDCSGSTTNPYSIMYPASYNNVLSVSGVGHIDPFGSTTRYQQNENWTCPTNGTTYTNTYRYNWKDVHLFRSGIPNTGCENLTSQQHNSTVDVVAPSINLAGINGSSGYGWVWGNGTSFAAPIVTGIASLIYSVNPCITANRAEAVIKNSADNIYNISTNSRFAGLLGTGRVNAYKALIETIREGTNYQQNLTYPINLTNNPNTYFGETNLVAGFNVTTGITGKVIVPTNGNVRYDVTRDVELRDGFEVLGNGKFEVRQLTSPCF